MQFQEFLDQRNRVGGFSTEDTLACLLPLIRQVVEAHDNDRVAPLDGLGKLQVRESQVFFLEDDRLVARQNRLKILKIEGFDRSAVRVVGHVDQTVTVDQATIVERQSQDVVDRDQEIHRPVYVPGYHCWEQLLGHHDPLTDIFNLGQILAAVALGIDFNDLECVRDFEKHRNNLFAIDANVHPVIARAIVRMTELRRDKRVQDLPLILRVLENYRSQETGVSIDPDDIPGFESRDLKGKQQVLLDRLQKRLFEISRRNRLLHFRSTARSINLTEASVPLSFAYQNIRQDQILVCDKQLEKTIAGGKTISLNERLNFAEAIYLPFQLDLVLRNSRRDLAEFGFEQLRLVLCMLSWSNLKEKPYERFCSPLLLVPVKLAKKRGVRDTYDLRPLGNDAEVNPVVRYLFKQYYDIPLPERIDLESKGLDSLYSFMKTAIANSEPAVELQKIDRPRIKLLHSLARRRLNNYRKRARISGRGVRTFRDIDYSYDPANWNPLGIKLFSEYFELPHTTLSSLVETTPKTRRFVAPGHDDPSIQPRRDSISNEEAGEAGYSEKSQTFIEMQTDDASNPFNWSFDLCQVTLANFRYRKMSLVRDYESLVSQQPRNEAFEAAFSLRPRPVDQNDKLESAPPLPLSDRYDVVPCDPTQGRSIGRARDGDSYIIQGPPGTGKSQTITNLITDFVARGKRVLFVCEKRAAIDVVFARLRGCGLADLCCLIHDSQADKKSFVMDLKSTYEGFLGDKPDWESVHKERAGLIKQIERAQQPIKDYSNLLRQSTYRAGIPTARLIEQCIVLGEHNPQLSEEQLERLPSWNDWQQASDDVNDLAAILGFQTSDGILANHPLRNLLPSLLDVQHPSQTLSQGLDAASRSLEKLRTETQAAAGDPAMAMVQIRQLIEHTTRLGKLAENNALDLLDAESQRSIELRNELRMVEQSDLNLKRAREENSSWRKKLDRRDLPAALDLTKQLKEKWFPFLRPSWWRLRKVLKQSYAFEQHAIKPGWESVLEKLQAEYQLEQAVEENWKRIASYFGPATDPQEIVTLIDDMRAGHESLPVWLARFQAGLFSESGEVRQDSRERIQNLVRAEATLRELQSELDSFLAGYNPWTVAQLADELDSIRKSIDLLPDYLRCLEKLQRIPEDVAFVLRRMNIPIEQIRAATAFRSLQMIARDHPEFDRFDHLTRESAMTKIDSAYEGWMNINAKWVRKQTQSSFLENVRRSDDSERSSDDFSKRYARGRKTLEHEFGKQMRYKSIRDLVSGDSGLVVRDLKPVWLMSPLSVSDALPLPENGTGHDFDVVIFDEASQITLESSIPTLFRANQAIVVGDEQQLPPTDFFSSKNDVEEQEVTFEHEGQLIQYDLESNSLLNHSARNLGSSMLGWHYRSRDEALISFSNWAFYDGRLLTIPEESLLVSGKPPLEATGASDADERVAALADRPISFHLMRHGVYLKRRNQPEADYIAGLVRQLLLNQDGRTIGVIAFSEAQQDEIERALDRLGKDDDEFAKLLEQELVREDDGQFVGLLVKNLENIQGDERDVIILSVCYGPDDQGRMIMNFGPINKSGGEKRLNVAFSRAKHHMAIVSTIQFSQITNEYNRGANCLRGYLQYAQAISDGDKQAAMTVLHSMAPWRDQGNGAEIPIADSVNIIGSKIQELGFAVDYNIGNSDFRCDIGIRKPGDTMYRLGVLVDAGSWYTNNDNLLDRELFRPRLLRVFGWRTYSILLKDWLNDSDRITREIIDLCSDDTVVSRNP